MKKMLAVGLLAMPAILAIGIFASLNHMPKAEGFTQQVVPRTEGLAAGPNPTLPTTTNPLPRAPTGAPLPAIASSRTEVAKDDDAVKTSGSTDLEREARIAEQVQVQFEADQSPVPESLEMKRTVGGAFRSFSDRGVKVENIDCRFRICRLDLVFDSVDADIKILGELLMKRRRDDIGKYGGAIAPMREYRADGSVKTVLYLAREGSIDVFE